MATPTPRISWSPEGGRLLVSQAGEVRTFDLDTAEERLLAGDGYFDARWLENGGVVAWGGEVVRFTIHGDPYGGLLPSREVLDQGSLSREGRVMVLARGRHGLGVDLGDETRYRDVKLDLRVGPMIVVISEDGDAVAMSYQMGASKRARQGAARGWLVAALSVTDDCSASTVLHDVRIEDAGPAPQMAFAFDRRAKRLAVIGTTTDDDCGVLRLGREREDVRMSGRGSGSAVALDARGMIAAYAVGGGKVRVDYLDPANVGPKVVQVVDSLSIDTDLSDITALAFDATSRMIACVSAANAVEIVPVL